jgi:hypothetical protein
LLGFIGRCSATVETIPLTAAMLSESVSRIIMADPTDNLILISILHHSPQDATLEKALLTANDKDFSQPHVRKELAAAGVHSYFRTAENLLGWIKSRAAP